MPLLMTVADTTAREALVITQADVDYGWEYKQLDTGVYYRPIASGTGSTIWAQSRPSSIRGFVLAPASTTDNAIARFDGTSGQLQNSAPTVADNGDLTLASGDFLLGASLAAQYTPTFTAGTNTTGAGTLTNRGHYMRLGSWVVVSVSILDVAHTAGAPTASDFEITLPIASDFAATTDCVGVVSGANVQEGGLVSGSIANNRAVVAYSIDATGNQTVNATFMYKII